tara:strand:- start:45 stop:449 length:405 start_codon:yes stop_codon:yes gene_type:complete
MGVYKGWKKAEEIIKKWRDMRKGIIKNSRGPDTVMWQAETNDVGGAVPKTIGELKILDMNKDQFKAAQAFKEALSKTKEIKPKKSRDLQRQKEVKSFRPEFDLKKWAETTQQQREQVRRQQKHFNRAAKGATDN